MTCDNCKKDYCLVYYEGRCPYCKYWIEGHFGKTWDDYPKKKNLKKKK